jgi:hypothetical protein
MYILIKWVLIHRDCVVFRYDLLVRCIIIKWVLIHRDCAIFRYDLYMNVYSLCVCVCACARARVCMCTCVVLGYYKFNLFCKTEVLIDDCGKYLFMIRDTV